MHFLMLLIHVSMHCWQDSSGMPLNYSPVNDSYAFKTGPLDDLLEFGSKKCRTELD